MIDGLSIRPARGEDLPIMWAWLNELPRWNFDDSGPKTFEEFCVLVTHRADSMASMFVATLDDAPVGFMTYVPISADVGSLAGICFSRHCHGSGIPAAAMGMFLDGLEGEGVRRICATLFMDNGRAWKFLKRLGFQQEGVLREHTSRDGVPLSMRMVARMKHDEAAAESEEPCLSAVC